MLRYRRNTGTRIAASGSVVSDLAVVELSFHRLSSYRNKKGPGRLARTFFISNDG